VEAEAALVVAGRSLLLRSSAEQGGVDPEGDLLGTSARIPGALVGRRAGTADRLRQLGQQLGSGVGYDPLGVRPDLSYASKFEIALIRPSVLSIVPFEEGTPNTSLTS
jgi:hypothetical protein